MYQIRLLVLMISLMLGVVISMHASAAKIAGADVLMQAATQNGSVRVIVTLQKLELPDRASKSPQDFDEILKSNASAAQSAVLDNLPASALIGIARRFEFTLQFAVTVTPSGLTLLVNNPKVLAIQEDRLNRPFLNLSVPHIFPSNDISTFNGSSQVIAILDSGVDKAHPFFASGKVISEACYSTNGTDPTFPSTSACPGGVSSSTASGSGAPCNLSFDGCDHGTHVAGIAAGFLNDGMHGAAKNGGILAVQVFSLFTPNPICGASSCILSYDSDQLAGLNRVYALRSSFNIASVNMSLGGGGPLNVACDSDARKPIIDQLKAADIATVIASGNDGFTTGISSPACISTAISVGATNNTVDTRASFSNVGVLLDLYAPGVSINSSIPGDGFTSWQGTSMATPHVAGAWAVMKHAKPTATVNEIVEAFKSTGVNVTSAGVTRKRINVDQALAMLLADPPPPPPPPSEDDDFILLVMPPILAAVHDSAPPPPPAPPDPNPQWSAITDICCPTSSATYGVTQGSQSRFSTLSSCSDTTPTFSGYLTTTPGSKFFSHNVTSGGCGILTGSGSQNLQLGKRYLWVAEFNDGNPQFVLYSENISSATGNLSATNFSSGGTTDGMVVETSGPLILEQDVDGQAVFQRLSLP